MKKNAFDEEMVECHFEGTIIPVPKKIFFEILLHVRLDGRKFVRYKDGAYIYSMSEREFYNLAHDAKAVYKRNKMALVKVDILDEYLEYFRE